jgi:ppGpp synthetase/RelA/SpoT-type nucleotidyltranferase
VNRYEEILEEYGRVYPSYHRLAEKINVLLCERLNAAGLRIVEVSSRGKEPASFVKKALRKGYADPLVQIGDKAGARVILPFARDRDQVLDVCKSVLELSKPEDKIEKLGSEKLGYLGMHYTAKIRRDALSPEELDLADLSAELQVHTKAESAWAVAAHDSLYKSVVPVPPAVARRLNRLSALAEIFDDQVEQFLVELHAQPGFAELEAVLPALDRLLLEFTTQAGDPGLSALIVPALLGLYDIEPKAVVDERVAPFVKEHRSELEDLYARSENDDRANPLLYQPEAFLLFERLATDPYRLRSAWPATIETSLLERLAIVRGARLS